MPLRFRRTQYSRALEIHTFFHRRSDVPFDSEYCRTHASRHTERDVIESRNSKHEVSPFGAVTCSQGSPNPKTNDRQKSSKSRISHSAMASSLISRVNRTPPWRNNAVTVASLFFVVRKRVDGTGTLCVLDRFSESSSLGTLNWEPVLERGTSEAQCSLGDA
uniref:Uncharacterized protein n=1 Tax=Steinernema glaseri TaxID=37863 RepID=A0A1I7Y7J8_9BILA